MTLEFGKNNVVKISFDQNDDKWNETAFWSEDINLRKFGIQFHCSQDGKSINEIMVGTRV